MDSTEKARQRCVFNRDGMCWAYEEYGPMPCIGNKETCVWFPTDEVDEESSREETIYTLNGLMQQFIKEGKDEEEQERRYRAYRAFFDDMDYEPEPVCEDLEEEINLAWGKLEKDYSPSALDKTTIIVSGLVGEKQFSNIARHFYELGRQSKPKVSEGLEEEYKDYVENDPVYSKLVNRNAGLDIARHFAQWQAKQDQETIELAEDHAYLAGAVNEREKIMKEAVEGFIFQSADYYPKELIAHYDGELGMGDKVRIIILPKED